MKTDIMVVILELLELELLVSMFIMPVVGGPKCWEKKKRRDDERNREAVRPFYGILARNEEC
jgi:hypothetical protein